MRTNPTSRSLRFGEILPNRSSSDLYAPKGDRRKHLAQRQRWRVATSEENNTDNDYD